MPAAVRTAVVGCGYWGKNLLRNFARLGALRAVCDADPQVAAAAADQYGVDNLSLAEVMSNTRINSVAIATPAETHAAVTLQAIQAGKHVFVEKPIALQLDDAISVRDAARTMNKVLMVGHLMQYHPAFLRLRQLVADGELGRLQHVYSHRLNLGKVRREENILWSFAPHDISMILELIGEEPESVSAIGAHFLHSKVADVTTTHLSFAGGQQAHVFVSWLHPYKEQKLVVVGDQGMAEFNDREPWERKLLLYPHKVLWKKGVPTPSRADPEPVLVEEKEPLLEEVRHFLDCVLQSCRCRTDADEAIRVLRVLQAAESAMQERRTVTLRSRAVVGARSADFFVHESAYVDEGAYIGRGTRIWHFSHILSRTQIGEECVIGQNVMIGPDVKIGNRCKIQNNVSVYKGVTLEDGVFCGPSCVFTNVNTPRAEVDRRDNFSETIVRRGATIGANATIVCGVELGEFSFVAAGATVTRDVSPFALVAGVPARRIGWVSHAGEHLGPDLTCPRTGRRYQETGDGRLFEVLSAAQQHG
jgi:predicted dehydrogenase